MLDGLLQQVKDAIFADPNNPYQHGHTGGLIGQIEGLFGQHQQQQGGQFGNVRPASEDRYGDPADQERNPRGMDPYGGVPNEAGRFRNVRPASEDPLGDPADNERR